MGHYKFRKGAGALSNACELRVTYEKAETSSRKLLNALLRYAVDHPRCPYGHHILVGHEKMRLKRVGEGL